MISLFIETLLGLIIVQIIVIYQLYKESKLRRELFDDYEKQMLSILMKKERIIKDLYLSKANINNQL